MKKKIFIVSLIVGTIILGIYIFNSNSRTINTDVNNNNINDNSDDINNSESAIGDFTISGGNTKIEGNKVLITTQGTYILSGILNGYIEITTSGDVILQLNNVTIKNDNGPTILVNNANSLTLDILDNTVNNMTDSSNYPSEDFAKGTIFSNDSIIIKGKGILNVIGNYKHGITSDDDIIINGGIVNIEAKTDGIHVNDHVEINDGKINIKSGSDAIESESTIEINGGEITITAADDGITSTENLIVNNGTIQIKSAYEGLESKNQVIINDGNISIESSDDGINATNDITINKGNIYVNSSRGDGIDSNGSLTINGGIIIALGAGNPEAGIDNDQTGVVINGGTVIAAGGSNSSIKTSSKQAAVSLGSISVGSIINITNDNDSILIYKIEKSFQNLIYSSNSLTVGSTYKVYTGGSVSGGNNFNGLYSGSSYSGGSLNKSFTLSSIYTNVGGSSSQGGGNHFIR